MECFCGGITCGARACRIMNASFEMRAVEVAMTRACVCVCQRGWGKLFIINLHVLYNNCGPDGLHVACMAE